MAQNKRTPGADTPEALRNVFVGTIDNSRDTASPSDLQARRIGRCFKFSPALASTVAELAFASSSSWRTRA